MEPSKYIVKDKFVRFTDPVTQQKLEIERTIVRTVRPCDAYVGDVRWKQRENGEFYLDFSDMIDPTPTEKDFPALMEAILLSCNADSEYVPVRFNYGSIGDYREIFIKKEDLEVVSGNIGVQVSGIKKAA